MSAVIVVAVVTPLEGHLQDVVDAFAVVSPKVNAEPGCELYALHHDGSKVIMVERWASAEALGVHAEAAAINELNTLIADHIAAPTDVSVLQNVPLGDPAKGTIQ